LFFSGSTHRYLEKISMTKRRYFTPSFSLDMAETKGDDYNTIRFKFNLTNAPKGIYVCGGFICAYLMRLLCDCKYFVVTLLGKSLSICSRMVFCAINSVLTDRSCWIFIAQILNIKLRLVLNLDSVPLSVAKQEVPMYKIGFLCGFCRVYCGKLLIFMCFLNEFLWKIPLWQCSILYFILQCQNVQNNCHSVWK
jgi:hypothetical protein